MKQQQNLTIIKFFIHRAHIEIPLDRSTMVRTPEWNLRSPLKRHLMIPPDSTLQSTRIEHQDSMPQLLINNACRQRKSRSHFELGWTTIRPSDLDLLFSSSNQNPATPPPLYTNIATNSVNNRNSTHAESRAHYDELVVRESLKHRTERIQHEPERASDHYSSSTYGEHRKTNGSDLYAEIASGSGSGAYQPAGSLHEPGYATVTNRDEHRASSNSGSTHLHVHSSRF